MNGGVTHCWPHTVQSLGHALPALCRTHVGWNDVLLSLCPSLPGLRRRHAALRCSAGSRVLRHSPTSPERSRPPLGLWPSRTGLDLATEACRRSPGSRACCFSACADRAIHSRLAWLLCCLPPLGTESASCSIGFSKLNSPAHRYLCLRFERYLAISPARLEARMDSLLSFPVGLFHPLQHAGLSRRSPDCRPSTRNQSVAIPR
jgi:hypothetical protein